MHDSNPPVYSSSVISYNIKDASSGWTALSDLQHARYQPACTTGFFEDQFGIFVTSGTPYSEDPEEDSVEFYIVEADTWVFLNPLQEKRIGHNLFEVDGKLMVAGGGQLSTELLEGTDWVTCLDLKERRWSSAGVNVPNGVFHCLEEEIEK